MSIAGRIYRILRSEVRERTETLLDRLESRQQARGDAPFDFGEPPEPPGPVQDPDMARWYANLEIPYGSDLATVEAAWKRLARRYHPDRHGSDPEKRETATEILKGINQAHEQLEKRLKASA